MIKLPLPFKVCLHKTNYCAVHRIIPTFRILWLICSYTITFQFITKLPLSVWNPTFKEWNHEGLRKWEENVKAHLRLNRGIRVVGLARFRRSDFLTVTTAFTSMSVGLWCFRYIILSTLNTNYLQLIVCAVKY